MKVLIIEDEQTAAENLIYLIKEIDPLIMIEQVIDSVEDSINYFNGDINAELVFMDIHLSDGISFEIFEKTPINLPIIFTTAYDEYALKAFKVNSIDYLLKPIDKDELKETIEKYKLTKQISTSNEQFQQMLQIIQTGNKSYKSTYLVQQRDTLFPLNTDDIAYFMIDSKNLKAITTDNKSYVMDKTLDDIAAELDPKKFFRANRQFFVQRKAIENIQLYFNQKLILNLNPKPEEQVIVSKVKATQLKKWMNDQ